MRTVHPAAHKTCNTRRRGRVARRRRSRSGWGAHARPHGAATRTPCAGWRCCRAWGRCRARMTSPCACGRWTVPPCLSSSATRRSCSRWRAPPRVSSVRHTLPRPQPSHCSRPSTPPPPSRSSSLADSCVWPQPRSIRERGQHGARVARGRQLPADHQAPFVRLGCLLPAHWCVPGLLPPRWPSTNLAECVVTHNALADDTGTTATGAEDLATGCADSVARVWSQAPQRQASADAQAAYAASLERLAAAAAASSQVNPLIKPPLSRWGGQGSKKGRRAAC